MFKKYACGCVGFVTRGMEPEMKRVYAFRRCKRHALHPRREYEVAELNLALAGQSSEKLADQHVEAMLDDLAELVSDGYALRELRRAMRTAGVGS
jgi:hypothetical protein